LNAHKKLWKGYKVNKYQPRLRPGATIALVGTASPLPVSGEVGALVSTLEGIGYNVKVGKTAYLRNGYLAGEDKERAQELMSFFQDGSVDAILSLRGGYGSMRILPLLDYSLIKKNRKPFIGFSDTTALHAAFYRYAKMISFHGPNIGGLVASGSPGKFAQKMLKTVFSSTQKVFSLQEQMPKRAKDIQILKKGIAKGRLVGGNLSLLSALCGTPFFPKVKNSILFFEDVGEPPYKVDRMLTQLTLAGVLNDVNGIVVGSFTDCDNGIKKSKKRYYQSIEDVLEERLGNLRVPIITRVPVGHGVWNATLPHGAPVELNAKKGDLYIPTINSLNIR
jgi:muramoyltetrapeptide carboxypeptidase